MDALARGRGPLVVKKRVDGDVGALLCQPQRDRLVDTLRAAGDEGHPVLQSHDGLA